MQNHVKEHLGLSKSLLLNGELFHVRWCAHILNLIVQDGLKVASNTLHKIRQSVKYIKVSERRTRQVFACIALVDGIDMPIGLRSHCVTRLNFTFTMFESAINYRCAFNSFSLHDTNYMWCPLEDEWNRAEIICDFFRPLNNSTKLISAFSYPTSNLYLGGIWIIECLLNSILINEDLIIQQMARNMKAKFSKYWSDYTMVLAFGTILDPSKKLDFVQCLFEEVDPFYMEKVKQVKINLYRLYDEYVNKDDQSNESHSQVQASSSLGGGKGKKFQLPLYQAHNMIMMMMMMISEMPLILKT
ncbi:unnamed protein product [Lupinus luteus]|uniref:hAT-like transposase RNase-H fold domain-containing protein n=1 Tax=Lupinus luteus TaxID=3873 RepID=A0AAV1Y144_LUPLU